MNIGDKVRVVHGNEEGFVTKIIDARLVEIEIEAGFTMPVLRNELVVINKAEKEHFDETQEPGLVKELTKKHLSNTGIFLAFVQSDSVLVDVYLINNTDYDLLCAISTISKDSISGIYRGIINSASSGLVAKWNIKEFNDWPDIQFQSLYFNQSKHTAMSPLSTRVKFTAKSFYNSKKTAPIIDKEAYVYSLDKVAINPNSLFNQEASSESIQDIEIPEDIVDLHIEKITEDNDSLSPSEKLEFQLTYFLNQLESAIAVQKPEITFIHGVGNGKLKQAIHKELSGRQDIAFFKDALKNKFGYGATLVGVVK